MAFMLDLTSCAFLLLKNFLKLTEREYFIFTSKQIFDHLLYFILLSLFAAFGAEGPGFNSQYLLRIFSRQGGLERVHSAS